MAPLGAPRSPASSPTMTASLAPLIGSSDLGVSNAGLDNNVNLTNYETTTHFEERTTRLMSELADLLSRLTSADDSIK